MKVNVHEPDPLEADVHFPDNDSGILMSVEPAFYGKSRSSVAFVVSTSTNKGKPLGSFRVKVSDCGKISVEDLGERRKLDIDSA